MACRVDGCDHPVEVLDMCEAHYRRLRKYGDVQADKPVLRRPSHRDPVCTVEGCDLPHMALGLCRGHHYRFTAHGDVMADKPFGTKRLVPRPPRRRRRRPRPAPPPQPPDPVKVEDDEPTADVPEEYEPARKPITIPDEFLDNLDAYRIQPGDLRHLY